MKKIAIIITLIASGFLVSGCIPAVVGGAAAGGKVLAGDKTVGEAVSDGTVWTKIRAGFISHNIDSLVGSVNVTVSEGRVLLTGRVKDNETMLKVIRVCWEQDGVKEVINELKVEEQSGKNLSGYTKDSWITARIKSKILVTKNVKSVNYTVETIDGIVYLMGIARTQDELDTVTDIAATVSGVERVVSYVKVQGNIESRIEKTRGKGMDDSPLDGYDDKPLPLGEERHNMNGSLLGVHEPHNPTTKPDDGRISQHEFIQSTSPIEEHKVMPNPNPAVQPQAPAPAAKAENWQKDEEFDDSF